MASAVSVNNANLIASSWACCPRALVLALFVAVGLVLVLLFAAVAVLTAGLVLLDFAALLSLLWSRCRRGSTNPEAGKIGEDGGAKRLGYVRTGAGGFTGLAVFLLKAVALGLLLLLSAPANGYCGERVCSMLTDIRCFPYSVHALLRRFVELVATQS